MKIKSLILTSLSAAALLASCSNDSVVADSSQLPASNAIKFNTSMANLTKSTVYSSSEKFNAFKVTALKETSSGSGSWNEYFKDVTVNYNSENKWVPSSAENWPSDGTALQFYAFTPTDLSASISSSAKTIDYTLPEDNANQIDVMTAFKQQTYNESDASTQTVKLPFRHALSQIVIKVKNADASTNNYSIEIAGVKIARVKGNGTLTFQTSSDVDNANETHLPSWNTESATADKSYVIDVTSETIGSDDYKDLTGSDKTFLMIPQRLTAWNKKASTDDNNGAYIAFKCKIKKGEDKILPADGVAEEYGWTAIPIGTTWLPGRTYTYQIEFFKNGGAGNKEPGEGGDPVIPGTAIKFDVQVDNWTDASGTPITLNNE